jgi:tetratricopeptide (TPR) repeat protein
LEDLTHLTPLSGTGRGGQKSPLSVGEGVGGGVRPLLSPQVGLGQWAGSARFVSLCILTVLITLPLLLPGSEGWAAAAARGSLLETGHRLRSAALEYRQVAEHPSGTIAGGLRLGRVYLQLERWQEAADVFRSIDARRAGVEVSLGLATALDRLGETRSGLELLRRELLLRPNGVEVWIRLVELAASADLSPEEIRRLLDGIADPAVEGADQQRVSYLKATCVLDIESMEGMQMLARAASGPDGVTAGRALELLAVVGEVASSTGFNTSVDPQPLASTTHLQPVALAKALLIQGLIGPALAYLAEIPREGAAGAEALALEGYGLMKLGRLDEAEVAIRRSLDLAPDQIPGQYLLGLLLLSRGEAVEAVRPLEKAMRRDPENPAILLKLGEALAEAGDLTNAGLAVEMAVQAAPEDADLRLAAARFYVDRQYRVDAALLHASEAVRLTGRSPDALATLGWAAHLSGDSQEALALLEESISVAPRSPLHRYRLASVLEALGQPERAREQFTMVWELDGSGEHWRRAQAALEGL